MPVIPMKTVISTLNSTPSSATDYLILARDTPTISTFDPGQIQLTDDFMKQILARLSVKPTVKHQCHSCGATLELDSNKHIFICKYCGSIYAVGTCMINDEG